MLFKTEIHNHYVWLLNQKIEELQHALTDLKETGANETKSTAGDKHETALAMIQIEQENKRAQLNELFAQKAALDIIDLLLTTSQVKTGSLVKTNLGYFYLSTALGKATINGLVVTAISPQSPLGRELPGKKAGDIIEINSRQFVIESFV